MSPDSLMFLSTTTSRFKNFNSIPFRSPSLARYQMGFPGLLESTNPYASVVHMEPFPFSAFNVLILIFATTTKICTDGRSAQACAQVLQRLSCPLTHRGLELALTSAYRLRTSVPSILGASWFGRWVVAHSLVYFDFHDHRPAVLIDEHPLWVLG